MTWAVDLDGVVWLAGRPIPGSAEAVSELRHAGEHVVFLTNNSGPLLGEHVKALGAVGIPCIPGDIATSAQAAASLLEPGTRTAVVGDCGINEALEARGIVVVDARQRPDAVVVGRDLDLDYWALAAAASAVRAGARFIATNTDATFPTGGGSAEVGGSREAAASGEAGSSDGLLPGAGALVAFVAVTSGRAPEVAGKPHPAMADLVKSRYGALSMVVGDRADTDGLFARLVGSPFGLVLSGVTGPSDLPVDPEPDIVSDNLASLVHRYLARYADRGGGGPSGHFLDGPPVREYVRDVPYGKKR